jgi:molecular chaperone DnaK (HSP70)
LAVDFGTCFTSVAIWDGEGRPEVVNVAQQARFPSAVLLKASDTGELSVGKPATNAAAVASDRVLRTPKRHLGALEVVLLGGVPVRVVDAVAAVLDRVVSEARRQRGGTRPGRVVMTHPARWGEQRLAALAEAGAAVGLENPEFVSEPVAAAFALPRDAVPVGGHVAVYDLGGGTFDTAVLRRTREGFVVAGPVGGDDHFGGEDLDRRVFAHLGALLADMAPEVWVRVEEPGEDLRWKVVGAELYEAAREIKERLSEETSVDVYVKEAGRDLTVSRGEFEYLVEPDLEATVELLAETVKAAGLSPENLAALYLVGGSGPIPLIDRLLHARFGIKPDFYGDPKNTIVVGAALLPPKLPAKAMRPPSTQTPSPAPAMEQPSRPERPIIRRREPGRKSPKPARPARRWTLAIDYGTTQTCAAVAVAGQAPELLEIEGQWRLPSSVALDHDGSVRVGKAARNLLRRAPQRGERTPKRHLGHRDLLPIGVPVVDAVAAVFTRVAHEARLRVGGTEPAQVVLTHPARWGEDRLVLLRQAAELAGLREVELVPEPVAAALHFAGKRQVEAGAYVAVYDLGGSTFDAAVLRANAVGFELVGEPGGNPDIGGEYFDHLLFDFVGERIAEEDPERWGGLVEPDDLQSARWALELRDDVRVVKEELSRERTAEVPVRALDAAIRVTKREFEGLIADAVADTVSELERTLELAGVRPTELAALYLAGDSTRIPAIFRALRQRFAPLEPTTWDDPKAVVALGAIQAARRVVRP